MLNNIHLTYWWLYESRIDDQGAIDLLHILNILDFAILSLVVSKTTCACLQL